MNAILVIGPESSGCRFLAELLCAVGYSGEWGHEQAFDQALPAPDRPIVWRRSVPHGKVWVCVPEWVGRAQEAGYDPYVIVCARDPHCMARSQVLQSHSRDIAEAIEKIQRAYIHIFAGLSECGIRFAVSTYENLAFHPEALSGVLGTLGLPPVPATNPELVKYANAKWYPEI